jgi:hypothetical protein
MFKKTKIMFVLSFLAAFAGSALAETTEVVYFKSKAGVSSSQLISSAKHMDKTLRTWKGFISRELVELGNGEWVDIVHWASVEAANKAAEIEATSEACIPFFAFIDETQIKMYRGDSVVHQQAISAMK